MTLSVVYLHNKGTYDLKYVLHLIIPSANLLFFMVLLFKSCGNQLAVMSQRAPIHRQCLLEQSSRASVLAEGLFLWKTAVFDSCLLFVFSRKNIHLKAGKICDLYFHFFPPQGNNVCESICWIVLAWNDSFVEMNISGFWACSLCCISQFLVALETSDF